MTLQTETATGKASCLRKNKINTDMTGKTTTTTTTTV